MSRQKVAYFVRSLRCYFDSERNRCPNCSGRPTETIQRKYLVTRLVRCGSCKLLFRTPTDPPRFSGEFYQEEYSSGFTTDCPSPEELHRFLDSAFVGSAKDFTGRIQILQALGVQPGARILDFGASWGYATWQLRKAGYDVIGFEISRPRARYAREKLLVPVEDDWSRIRGEFHVFFSSHVIEHLPAPADAIAKAQNCLVPGGLFLAFTPNGSLSRCDSRKQLQSYRRWWGLVHPVLPDENFYEEVFAGQPSLCCSSPYDPKAIASWDQVSSLRLDLRGDELMVAARLRGPN